MSDENRFQDLESVSTRQGGGTKSVMAKLVKVRGFARGDFQIVQGSAYGVIVTNIPITDANISDKGRTHVEGEFFTVHNYPINSEITSNSNEVNRPAIKANMNAEPILTQKDNIARVNSIPPAPFNKLMGNIADNLVAELPNLSGTCRKAPRNLKEAVARIQGAGTGQPGTKYKSLPPNSKTKDSSSGKTFQGLHLEYDESGAFNVAANNKGFIVDDKGNIDIQGRMTFSSKPGTPHGLVGMPTFDNPMREINPGTWALPMGLGPLALKSIPDFSSLNFVIKLLLSIAPTLELMTLIDKKVKSGQKIGTIVEAERQRTTSDRLGDLIE